MYSIKDTYIFAASRTLPPTHMKYISICEAPSPILNDHVRKENANDHVTDFIEQLMLGPEYLIFCSLMKGDHSMGL